MSNYDFFAKFYDSVMGNKEAEAPIIESWIKKHNSNTATILELACGTGVFLRYFFDRGYKVTGIDLSEKMLDVARQKLPEVNFLQEDMTVFSLPLKFDVIVCLFDSINHIIGYEKWEQVFFRVHAHLNEGGLFIFDINTIKKLKALSLSGVMVKKFNKNIVAMKVTGKDEIYNWNIKISEKMSDGQEKTHEENIQEQTFSIKKTEASLKKIFSRVNLVELNGESGTENSNRVYFIASK